MSKYEKALVVLVLMVVGMMASSIGHSVAHKIDATLGQVK
jgi:hypothetical protein